MDPPLDDALLANIAQRLGRLIWSDADAPEVLERLRKAGGSTTAVASVARWMAAEPKATDGAKAFIGWWLALDGLLTVEKQDPSGVLGAQLRQDMIDEVTHMGANALTAREGRLADLLTGRTTFVNERLANHYGIAGVTGEEFRQARFPDDARIGLFSTSGMLTQNASYWQPTWPSRRSAMLFERLLCEEIPAPPPQGLPTDPRAPLRAQTIATTARPGCPVCHVLLNPPGFAFLEFDTFGRARPTDVDGQRFDTSGTFPDRFVAEPLTFQDAGELMRGLAGRPETMACFARVYLKFALGGDKPLAPPTKAEESALPVIRQAFADSGGRFDALLDAVVRADPFLQR